MMSVPEPLAHRLQTYAFRHGLTKSDRFFNMNRQRDWQIVKRAAREAGTLRHSDAIERARQLRHPKALQGHFGWSSPSYILKHFASLGIIKEECRNTTFGWFLGLVGVVR
jgi:hypothetical protein